MRNLRRYGGALRAKVSVGIAVIATVCVSASANPPTADLFNWQGPCFNCYNYACNTRGAALNAYFAQPGVAAGAPAAAINCAGVQAAAVADGLMFLGNPAPGQPLPNDMGKCVVGLAIDPGAPGRAPDYHWYRLNQTGRWSDKPGQTPAKDFGLVAPHNNAAGRGLYTQFCGYFGVDSAAPPAIAGNAPSWLQLGFGFREYVLSYSGLASLPVIGDALDLLDLLTHTPAAGPLGFTPLEPDLTLTRFAGCSAVMDQGSTVLFPGLSSRVQYMRAFTSPADGLDYIAAYTQLDPMSSGAVTYYLDDRGMGDYLCSIPGPGAGGVLAMAGVICLGRRRRGV